MQRRELAVVDRDSVLQDRELALKEGEQLHRDRLARDTGGPKRDTGGSNRDTGGSNSTKSTSPEHSTTPPLLVPSRAVSSGESSSSGGSAHSKDARRPTLGPTLGPALATAGLQNVQSTVPNPSYTDFAVRDAAGGVSRLEAFYRDYDSYKLKRHSSAAAPRRVSDVGADKERDVQREQLNYKLDELENRLRERERGLRRYSDIGVKGSDKENVLDRF